jgi:alkylation response protein AidB-like acyl-CoA dehydrogenase
MPRLTGLNATFADEAAALQARHTSVRERLLAHCAQPQAAAIPDLLRLRLDGAQTAGEAARLETTVCGGAAYAIGSPVNRRLREAAFLPIQSPTEGQLRWELSWYT